MLGADDWPQKTRKVMYEHMIAVVLLVMGCCVVFAAAVVLTALDLSKVNLRSYSYLLPNGLCITPCKDNDHSFLNLNFLHNLNCVCWF